MAAMLDSIAYGIGAHPSLTWVAAPFLDAEKVEAWSDMPVWVPGSGDTAGFHRRGNRAALAAGLTFRPLSATAADTLAWFRTLPAERQAKLRAGVSPEREAAILAKWRAGQ
jgi:2'-hydroxyisoflavone reductase